MAWGNSHITKPLSIITKKQWLEKKEEFKKIKQELQNENRDIFVECLGQETEDINSLTPGTLIRLDNLPEKVDKFAIKTYISHFVEPAYVDLNSSKNICFVRFSHPLLAENFIKKIGNEENFRLNDKRIIAVKVNEIEEQEYFKMVELKKQQLKSRNKRKHKTEEKMEE